MSHNMYISKLKYILKKKNIPEARPLKWQVVKISDEGFFQLYETKWWEEIWPLKENTGELVESYENEHTVELVFLFAIHTRESNDCSWKGSGVQGRGGRQSEGYNHYQASSPRWDR